MQNARIGLRFPVVASSRSRRLGLAVVGGAALASAFACGSEGSSGDAPAGPQFDAGTPFAEKRAPVALPAGAVVLAPDPVRDSASLFDARDLSSLGGYDVGRDPVDQDGPSFPAIDRAHSFAYVVFPYPEAKRVYGPHTERAAAPRAAFLGKMRLSDLRLVDDVRTDVEPSDFALSADGSRAVLTFLQADRLAGVIDGGVVDDRRGLVLVVPLDGPGPLSTVFPKRVVPCGGPAQVVLRDGAGDSAFVACFGDDAIASVTGLRGTPAVTLTKIAGGVDASSPSPNFGPSALALSSAGRLAVSSRISNDLRVLEPSGTFATTVVPLGGVPGRLAWSSGGTKIVATVTTPPSLVIVDGVTLAKIATRELAADGCDVASSVTVLRDDVTALVTCTGAAKADGVLLSIDLSQPTLAVTARVPLPGSPQTIAVGEAQ